MAGHIMGGAQGLVAWITALPASRAALSRCGTYECYTPLIMGMHAGCAELRWLQRLLLSQTNQRPGTVSLT
jgi:hypothetical protein